MPEARKRESVAAYRQGTLGPMELEPTTATHGNSNALARVNEAIDHFAQRKVVADHLHVTEQHLSKLTSGTQAFGVALFDGLPDALVLDICDRIARERGGRVVREDEDVLVAQRLAEVANEFVRVRVRTAR